MRILVAYASKHGATREIAERIALRLRGRGLEAEAQAVDNLTDVRGWSAFVIGSAVYFGAWRREAAEFVTKHRDFLSRSPVWLFSSGPVGGKELPAPKEIAGFERDLGARDHRIFAGRLDRARLSMKQRLVIRAVKAPYGDFRDWAAIDSWAQSVADSLTPEAVEVGAPAAYSIPVEDKS